MDTTLLAQFALQLEKSSPLFLMIFLGYTLSRWFGFNKTASNVLAKFAFNIALPAMLFRLLSNIFVQEGHADLRLLIAYFGACFILFFVGRFIARKVLGMSAVGSAIFGTGCVFSNNGLLGLPLAIAMLGEQVTPSISAVLSMNAMILWTLVSITVEFALQTGHLTWRSFFRTVLSVFKNPLIISIFLGVLWSLTGLKIPYVIDEPIRLIGNSATAMSLIVVGMGLAEYGLGPGIKKSFVLSGIKLFLHPLLIYTLAVLIGLGPVETTSVVFLGCLPIGVNVYLMCRQFQAAEDVIANAMIITTVVSSFTVPLAVTLLRHTGIF
ncbi:AEC family transporter [uncultured Parasutterella sp.]|uniref:AEC family transporter n=1 Tax=uncultured Parasutterella sp. TaxID=1263098 RepID=UPI0025B64E91|nr:AEC family transporter [uncultured Parasutterella sp.]